MGRAACSACSGADLQSRLPRLLRRRPNAVVGAGVPADSAFADVQKGGDYTRTQSIEAGSFALFIGGKRIPVCFLPCSGCRSD